MIRLRPSGFGTTRARLRGVAASAGRARARVGSGLERTVLAAVVVAIGGGSSVLACPMCFGAEEGALIDGAKLGILVMLAITFSVQGAFVGFFIYLRQRGKRITEADLDTEWSELQRGSRTS